LDAGQPRTVAEGETEEELIVELIRLTLEDGLGEELAIMLELRMPDVSLVQELLTATADDEATGDNEAGELLHTGTDDAQELLEAVAGDDIGQDEDTAQADDIGQDEDICQDEDVCEGEDIGQDEDTGQELLEL
jgi:hypothetical protein